MNDFILYWFYVIPENDENIENETKNEKKVKPTKLRERKTVVTKQPYQYQTRQNEDGDEFILV